MLGYALPQPVARIVPFRAVTDYRSASKVGRVIKKTHICTTSISVIIRQCSKKREKQRSAICYLDRLDLRRTFPRIHQFAELGKVPGS